MDNTKWSKFTKRIPVNSSKTEIYNSWTTRQGLERWFLRSAIYESRDGIERNADEGAQKGDTYRWFWHGYPDSVFEENVVSDANSEDLFQFMFSGDNLVTVRIKEISSACMVEITQEEIEWNDDPAKNLLVGCGEGWTFYLANLKSVLEGGLDLRNKELEITGVINS